MQGPVWMDVRMYAKLGSGLTVDTYEYATLMEGAEIAEEEHQRECVSGHKESGGIGKISHQMLWNFKSRNRRLPTTHSNKIYEKTGPLISTHTHI